MHILVQYETPKDSLMWEIPSAEGIVLDVPADINDDSCTCQVRVGKYVDHVVYTQCPDALHWDGRVLTVTH